MSKLFSGDLYSQSDIQPMGANQDVNFFHEEVERPMALDAIKRGLTDYALEDLRYVSNSAGFRCDEFEVNDAPVVVFTGCSFTFGHGLPLQDVWAHRIVTRLRNEINPNIRYFNVGRHGAGLDTMVRALLAFRQFAVPHVVVGLVPERSRTELYLEPNYVIETFYKGKHERSSNNFMGKDVASIATLRAYEEHIIGDPYFDAYRVSKNLSMLDLFRQSTGSKMMLSTWSAPEHLFENVDDDFSHLFVPFTFSTNPDWPQTVIGKRSKYALDGVHPGPASHEAFANLMYPLVRSALE
jgi:hypothetical protein